MPPKTTDAERRAADRAAAGRRQAAESLRYGARLCEATAAAIMDGTGPGEARRALAGAAADLASLAEQLRRAARPCLGERLWMTRKWTAQGLPRAEIARRLGVSERVVYFYQRGRPAP